MDTNNLATWNTSGLVLENQNTRLPIDPVLLTNRRKSLLIYLTRPEITGDGKQVRITK
ncbi:MAG TPA: hypothetical protein VLJ11_19185 [Bryobacteraceae bacterium]|nr:hypothetical protein [Bryobacteraceae bacterium]